MAFTNNRKSFKKSYQFLKYGRAYLRKGRYAPGDGFDRATFFFIRLKNQRSIFYAFVAVL